MLWDVENNDGMYLKTYLGIGKCDVAAIFNIFHSKFNIHYFDQYFSLITNSQLQRQLVRVHWVIVCIRV